MQIVVNYSNFSFANLVLGHLKREIKINTTSLAGI